MNYLTQMQIIQRKTFKIKITFSVIPMFCDWTKKNNDLFNFIQFLLIFQVFSNVTESYGQNHISRIFAKSHLPRSHHEL